MVPSAQTSLFKTDESANQKQVRDVVNIIRCRDALVIPTNEPCRALGCDLIILS